VQENSLDIDSEKGVDNEDRCADSKNTTAAGTAAIANVNVNVDVNGTSNTQPTPAAATATAPAPAPSLSPSPSVVSWVPDRSSKTCTAEECAITFSVFTRRHHCRSCGNLFCGACAPKRKGETVERLGLGLGGSSQRVCGACLRRGSGRQAAPAVPE
jgi:hypothetical protein